MLSDILSGDMGFADVAVYLISTLFVVFLTLPIHEFAHAFAAVKLGDNTPKWQGRYTINPFAHIDYFGALCILLFGFGWAKPVGVNARNFRNDKWGMAIVAFAGPLSNLLVALVSLILLFVFSMFELGGILAYIPKILFFVALINVYLAVFNLIPIPPLDGSRLLSAFLPDRYYYALMRYERYIFLGLLALLYVGVLEAPLDLATEGIMNLLIEIASLPFRLLNIF